MLSTVRQDYVKRNLREDFIYGEGLPRCPGNCCTHVQTFCVRETGKERGGEEKIKRLPFSCSFPLNPPAPSRSAPPPSTRSRRKQAATWSRGSERDAYIEF